MIFKAVVYFMLMHLSFGFVLRRDTGYSCVLHNPCSPLLRPNQYYYSHNDVKKFIQCDTFGGCFEMPCAPGTVWNQTAVTCVHGINEDNGSEKSTTLPDISTSLSTKRVSSSILPDEQHSCRINNPCSPLRINDQYYYTHFDKEKFVQCDDFGGCFEKTCANGTVWNQEAYSCVHDIVDQEPSVDTTTSTDMGTSEMLLTTNDATIGPEIIVNTTEVIDNTTDDGLDKANRTGGIDSTMIAEVDTMNTTESIDSTTSDDFDTMNATGSIDSTTSDDFDTGNTTGGIESTTIDDFDTVNTTGGIDSTTSDDFDIVNTTKGIDSTTSDDFDTMNTTESSENTTFDGTEFVTTLSDETTDGLPEATTTVPSFMTETDDVTTAESTQTPELNGFDCVRRNPCSPLLVSDQYYYEHYDETYFVQCDEHGGCFEMPCSPGTVWNQDAYACVHGNNYNQTDGNQSTTDRAFESTKHENTTKSPIVEPSESPELAAYDCIHHNPCLQLLVPDQYYYSHYDASKFVQCDAFGGCFEMNCGRGTVWNQAAFTCIHAPM